MCNDMATSFPWDKLKIETIKSVCHDLGIPESQKAEMVAALQNATAKSNLGNYFILIIHILPSPPEPLILGETSCLEVAQEKDGAPKREPFDFSRLCFIVHLVTSADGHYHGNKNLGPDIDFDNRYDSKEDELEEDDDPWLKIYYVKIETTDGTQIGQFGYKVIDKSAHGISIWMEGGAETRYYNLAEQLHFSERGGLYLEIFSNALWNNNLKNNPMDSNLKEELVTGDWKGTGVFQRELNEGSFTFISDDLQFAKNNLFIQEKYCGWGIATGALKQLFNHNTLKREDRDVAKKINDGVQLFF
ncbi:hypothetical protein PILCRDRAFT_797376 [Piloderma croceum F 1598]|uniref:Uncharacterized protein n=1 Tax=Piloderma croceum (strain F 1598) TaxID=765440 RepID=A0A0C3F962_PILCF|nr:hypothetical protein PILCRDRAFT_797376 [Piloderma croceum F 1598]